MSQEDEMGLYQKPPKPDALQTIVSQLTQLHDEWGRAASQFIERPDVFYSGQQDAWRQAQRQIKALIDSIERTRESGIYLTDAQQELVRFIEDRHRTTMDFLDGMERNILEALAAKEE